MLFLPDLSQDFSFLALGFHPPWPWAIQRAHLCFALKSSPRNGVAKCQGCSHSGVTRTKLLEEKLMILRKKKLAWGGLSSVWHITRDIWQCLGTWTTSAASPHALGVGYALLYILCKNHFTFWRAKIHLVHMPFHLQPKRKSQKSCISIVHLALWFLSIFLAFVCVGMCILWERIMCFNVFCSCLVGPLLKPYGPPWAEKLGWKIQRDSLVQIQCRPFEVLGASTAARSN